MYLALLGIELAGVELLAEIAQYRPAASKYSDSKADETMAYQDSQVNFTVQR